MLDLVKRFVLNALRIFVIAFVVIFCVTLLTKCGTESETESLTVLSLQSSKVIENHIGDVPVKTIVSNSNIDEEVDIVVFGTPESFEKYSDNFEILETVSGYTAIPFSLYNTYTTNYGGLNFFDIIDGFISQRKWNSLFEYLGQDLIELNYDVSGDEGYAFYTLLFRYFSNGKSSEKLSDTELTEVINKVKNFINEYPSVNIGGVATFNSALATEYYYKVELNQKVVIERKICAVTEVGKKYLNKVADKLIEDSDLLNTELISCENMNLLDNFMDTNVTEFSYNSELSGKTVELVLKIVWGAIVGGIILFVCPVMWAVNIKEWKCLDVLFGSILTGIFILFELYSIAVMICILWLIMILIFDEWFYNFSYEFRDFKRYLRHVRETRKEAKVKAIEEQKKKAEEAAKAIEQADASIEQFSSQDEKVIEMLNAMDKFNEEMGIETDVWRRVCEFIRDYPSSFSLMSGLIDNKVHFVLNAYHDLPRDSHGNLRSNFDLKDRTSTILMKLNKVTENNFEEKKKIYQMDTNAWLNLAENELNNEINFN